jgi:GGDEF domain-containing protein
MGVIVFSDDKIHWINHWLLNRLQSHSEALLGLSKEKALDSDFSALFSDEETLRLSDSSNHVYWLNRQQHFSGEYKIHYFQDITSLMQVIEERNQLRAKCTAQQVKEPSAGLLNEQAILQALTLQVGRSRRYQNPLSVIELSISTQTGKACGTDESLAVSRLLKDQLRWADQIGLLSEGQFLIILPETSRADALKLIRKLREAEGGLLAQNSTIHSTFTTEEWVKGDDSRKLLKRLKERKAQADAQR